MEHVVPVKPGFGGFAEPYERARVVFLGVPLDLTSSYRPGMRFGPTRIREASMNLETYLMSAGVDVFESLGISDLGDLELPSSLEASGARIRQAVKRLLEEGKIPALLGGEHTLTYFSLQGFGDVKLVSLDAHLDLRDEYLGDRLCHATVMRRVLELLGPERMLQLGARSCSKAEAELLGSGLKVFPTEQLAEELSNVVKEVKGWAGSSPLYLSLDLDVLDPAFAPGVATPEPGGLSTREVLKLVRELGKLNLRGFDVVELAAPYDDGRTAFAAARIIYEVLASLASSAK